jgi:tetratricopeptide (TPR) repeat protein
LRGTAGAAKRFNKYNNQGNVMLFCKGSLQRFIVAGLLLTAAFSLAASSLDEDLSVLRDARDLSAIEQRLAEASEDELNSVVGLRWQAWLAQGRQETDVALALLERALELEPDNVELILMRSGMVLSGLSASGGLSALRQARAMSRELERAVELAPDHVGARVGLVQYLTNAPRIAGGGSRKAEEHLEALKRNSPASYLGLKAQSAMADQDLDAAIGYLEQAIELDGSDDWRFIYGLALQHTERWDEARALYTAMVSDNPRNGAAWYQVGRTAVLSEDNIEAGMAAFEHFLQLPHWPGDPTHAAAWWRIGQLHEIRGEVDQAREAYDRSLAEHPDFEEARAALKALQG